VTFDTVTRAELSIAVLVAVLVLLVVELELLVVELPEPEAAQAADTMSSIRMKLKITNRPFMKSPAFFWKMVR
jgi:hypothetical protein